MNEVNNKVRLTGTIFSEPKFSHFNYEENFYSIKISVSRDSGCRDIIPVLVSDRLFDIRNLETGKRVDINGQIRSFNKHDDEKTKLILNVFANDIVETYSDIDTNEIALTGFLCKAPIFRLTPLRREIADILVAVNRSYGKSDYIPCICWGRNAKFASHFVVGDMLFISGRIQSRDYVKKYKNGETEERTAYEVSIRNIGCQPRGNAC